jgi:cbb3-type cytochrome oxidase maturation protein
MEVIVFLAPLALLLGLAGLFAFLWTLKTGQYDDIDGAAWRAILDDDEIEAQTDASRFVRNITDEAPKPPSAPK